MERFVHLFRLLRLSLVELVMTCDVLRLEQNRNTHQNTKELQGVLFSTLQVLFIFLVHLSGRRHQKAVSSARARARRKQFLEESESGTREEDLEQKKQEEKT